MMKVRKITIRLIIASLLWLLGIVLYFAFKIKDNLLFNWQELIVFILIIVAYLIAGIDVIISAFKKIFHGELLAEDFLMMIASLSAIFLRILGDKEYIEAAGIMIFYQVGELFQTIALDKSRHDLTNALKLKVTTVHLASGKDVTPDEVIIGTDIIINAYEAVPIDGIALNNGTINQASLTGEAMDKYIESGELVLSGSINQNTPLLVKTTKLYKDSTTAKILEMVENATCKKAKIEKAISRFAKIYTPIVVALAFILGIITPLISGFMDGFTKELFPRYLYLAILCLVVSCPCALVISIPLTYFSSIGAASKQKIIIKGSTYLDALAKCNLVLTDKTGTLTKAKFKVSKIVGSIIPIAKGLEKNSTHPLASAVNEIDGDALQIETNELAGFGVSGILNGDQYLIGSYKLMTKEQIDCEKFEGHVLYVAKNKELLGYLELVDELKDEAKKAIDILHKMNKEIIILSGDELANTKKTADELNITTFHASLLPLEKVKYMEEYKIKAHEKSLFTTYLGDGINDAPVLKMADCGISMGKASSDSAIDASDIVILNDDLSAIPKLFKIAKKNERIIKQNIFISLFLKIVILLLAILSNFIDIKVPMALAIFADVGMLIIAILNSLRAFKTSEK